MMMCASMEQPAKQMLELLILLRMHLDGQSVQVHIVFAGQCQIQGFVNKLFMTLLLTRPNSGIVQVAIVQLAETAATCQDGKGNESECRKVCPVLFVVLLYKMQSPTCSP